MKRKQILIALATLLALSAGLPALGSILPIYQVGWGADVEAYAIASGACGHVDRTAITEGHRHHFTFCFGDSVEVRAQGSNGGAALGGLWVSETYCQPDEWGDEYCENQGTGFSPEQVEFAVDPLLESATVTTTFTHEWGCQSVDLELTASEEPSLTTNTGGTEHSGSLGVNGGYENVYVGPSSGSVGRNATVSGSLCGVTIGAGTADGNGRIMRGLGTTGMTGGFGYG